MRTGIPGNLMEQTEAVKAHLVGPLRGLPAPMGLANGVMICGTEKMGGAQTVLSSGYHHEVKALDVLHRDGFSPTPIRSECGISTPPLRLKNCVGCSRRLARCLAAGLTMDRAALRSSSTALPKGQYRDTTGIHGKAGGP
eukprot:TRINITY_DN14386_c0_g1_i1.p2 TRINITY_DN14386_c0_g1~~TRINITY_DN14386_c0_g1_i1.p2  ORF type:complete len:140 (-),score=0.42 TRINITY_DN14386_c0_g1_i1:110-529(-)